MPAPDASPRSAGSPAVVVTAGCGVLGLLVALNPAAFPIALFLAAVSLAALPMALGDRPPARLLRFALVGAACAVLALVLVLLPLLTGGTQRDERRSDPVFTGEETPSVPKPARSPSPAP